MTATADCTYNPAQARCATQGPTDLYGQPMDAPSTSSHRPRVLTVDELHRQQAALEAQASDPLLPEPLRQRAVKVADALQKRLNERGRPCDHGSDPAKQLVLGLEP